jgi:hypothetical protein
VFATEIVSDADDHRYAARQGEDVIIQATLIPLFVADRCRALAAALDLHWPGSTCD